MPRTKKTPTPTEYDEIVAITEGRDPKEVAEAATEAPKRPKGWPKGKPRGPKIPRSEGIRDAGIIAKTKKVRTRKGLNFHKFYVDPNIIPSDMDYQWVAVEVLGQLQSHRRVGFEANGWEAVPASRHDGVFMPTGWKGEINIEGLVLMERPMELSEEAKTEEYDRAHFQVAEKERQLGLAPSGTMERVSPKIKKTMERLAVPEK